MPSEPGLTLRFKVTIDHKTDLGNWSKCDGLSVEYDIFEYKEGGENGFIHRLPGRRKYQNIKLTRPLDSQSAKVATWVSKKEGPLAGHTAEIAVLDAQGGTVAAWTLSDVFPARWSGPTLDIGGKDVAYEILELAHNGFLSGA
jgi:phage tail-like protein